MSGAPVWIVAADAGAPRLAALLVGLFGGLALFLFGMEQLSKALKVVAGDRMRTVLARLTANRVFGALTGAFVTAVIQSSSVTTVLVVGFVSAGLMTMQQSVGVIMGANIGTTITAQIIAFKVTRLALALIAAGFGLTFFSRDETRRQYGYGVLGLGLVFFGMGVMGDAMAPLRTYQPFLDGMTRLEAPAIGILAAALFTAAVQSSSATTAIVIVMASEGLVTLPAGIALILGANVGTCATAILAALGKPREAMRAAAVHVLFNIAGVVIWLPFLDQLARFTTWLSPAATALDGTARLAADVPRQIANAHTTFNVVSTLLFLGLTPLFARVAVRLVPDRPKREEEQVQARYLDEVLLSTPALALDRVRLETLHLGDYVGLLVREALPAALDGDAGDLDRLAALDDPVDALHGHVIRYLAQVSQEPLSEDQTSELMHLFEVANSLEAIGDIVETNLVNLGRERQAMEVRPSVETRQRLEAFHDAVLTALDASVQAATQKSAEAAQRVVGMKQEINRLSEEAARHQARRLLAEAPNRLPAYTVETDILSNLKRIYYFTKRIARAAVPLDAKDATLSSSS